MDLRKKIIIYLYKNSFLNKFYFNQLKKSEIININLKNKLSYI